MAETSTMRDMMTTSYGDERASKNVELNDTMSIATQSEDAYGRAIETLKGNTGGN